MTDLRQPSAAYEYYGGDRFWNELPAVIGYTARLSTGDPTDWWSRMVKRRWATPARKRALMVGCGNGWVERDLYDTGLAEEFDGFDASEFYVREAESKRGDRKLNYFVSDFRSFEPRGKYDLVVNHAALHHADWLYQTIDRIADCLGDDGIFVNWEYIGASRNQYSPSHVELLRAVNDALPARFRTPHPLRQSIAAFLKADPSEAVHASEIVEAFNGRFETLHFAPVNGGIAYQILWNNVAEFAKGDSEANAKLSWLLGVDEAATREGLIPPSFAFFVGRPRKASGRARFNARVREPIREGLSKQAGGVYLEDLVNMVRHRGVRGALDRAVYLARSKARSALTT